MFKSDSIRPISLGIAKKDNKILVGIGYDKVKQETFYRALGGGIEFGETSKDAVKREFQEEIHSDITVGELLGVTENIFTYQGKTGHEIVFLYSIEIPNDNFKNDYEINDEVGKYNAVWVNINDFKSGKKIIYPEGFLKYI